MLLTKNEIRAIKKLIFSVVRKTLKIDRMDTQFDACDVDLSAVLVWAIREQRLFSSDTEDMEFNIKLDGRPLGGMYVVVSFLVFRVFSKFYKPVNFYFALCSIRYIF